MLLINKAARCIDLRGKTGEKFRLLPAGEAVKVPSEVADRAFAKNLIAKGDIAIIAPAVEAESEDESKAKGKAGK